MRIKVPTSPLVITITDHALMRYMERVKGMDFEPMRDELRAIIAPAIGARSLRKDGMEYLLDGHKLITVQPKPKHVRRKK